MAVEIEFSVMIHHQSEADTMRPWLDDFERQYNIRVHLVPILWAGGTGWMEIANMAIHQHGVDVSEIGTTWVGSLAAMGALRPFSTAEIDQMGGADAYFDVLWKAGILIGDERVWAIPWLTHPLVLYYRSDWVAQAGITEPMQAFKMENIFQTLQALLQGGIAHPLAIEMAGTSLLHEASMWIWQAGGEFMNTDGTEFLFNHPAALNGLKNYFSLRRYLAVTKFNNTYHDAVEVFMGRNTASVVAGPWMALTLPRQNTDLPFAMVSAPGITHVGGSGLIIWKHTRHPEAAYLLVHYLSERATEAQASPHAHVMPGRRAAFDALVARDPYYQIHLDTVKSGRTYPVIRQWGFIEQKLVIALETIWEMVFTDPFGDLDNILHRQLDPLARRLNNALEGTR